MKYKIKAIILFHRYFTTGPKTGPLRSSSRKLLVIFFICIVECDDHNDACILMVPFLLIFPQYHKHMFLLTADFNCGVLISSVGTLGHHNIPCSILNFHLFI